ncbi:predicted protein [Naegleria gruberi]|uniref:Predicted protein n=1 Tax=Naegleria gruberi TaxID=5762 RepID=D2VE40_NAEGR|nr:uncharacterized protein NAEGRDRAFT_67142 [Naegleria gruberi]EFC44727.1 predicted protein [Naegleria gruberi]|eukprot:XP_002677471.1 predicted protein [Naegleria gruberi strain NEG-M]
MIISEEKESRDSAVVQLIDFNLNRNENSLVPDLFQKLNNTMKNSPSVKNHLKFSQNFEKIGVVLLMDDGIDLVISEQYDCLIINDGNYLKIYNLPQEGDGINLSVDRFKCLLSVQYEYSFACMKLVNERGEDFIYATARGDCVVIKIRVSDLMKGEPTLIWQSIFAVEIEKLDVFKNKVYITSGSEIIILDSSNGQPPILEVNMPAIVDGYYLKILSENQILVGDNEKLKLYGRNNGEWILISDFLIGGITYIYHEEVSNLLYISINQNKGNISVIEMKNGNFELVKTFGEFVYNTGMKIDRRSGYLYVCNTCSFEVLIYK